MTKYDSGGEFYPDESLDHGIHSNACYDLVRYIRSNTIRNEEQFLLTTLGYITGFMEYPEHYVSGMLIGTSSSGKTHVKDKVDDLFLDDHLYQVTTGSDKALVYDDEWDEYPIASLDELQKPSQAIIEFLKSVHGGDEEFRYRTTEGSVRQGFEANEIVRKAKPYWFLYAQYDSDFEMFNRLLKIPVHESTSKNKAVMAMEFDHDHITVEGDDTEYGFDYGTGTRQLQTHIAHMHDQIQHGDLPGYVHLPTGDDHGWSVSDIVEPIFNHNRTEVNRIYGMVANLIRASALFNYYNRDVEEIYHSSYGTIDAIIAEPQDVANILSCRETLVSTTHGLDDKRWAICKAIESRGGAEDEVEGIEPIIDYLKTSDAPLPPESEMENLLEDLADNYLVEIHPGAGNKGRDIYEFLGFDELGFARVPEHEELFDNTFDPISGRNFVDVHMELRDELESRGADVMNDAPATQSTSGGSGGSRDGSGGSLADYGGGSGPDVDLEPHEEAIRLHMKRNLDGNRVEDMTDVPIEGLIGLTDPNDPDLDVEYDETLLDPDNTIWTQPDKDDSWVSDVKDAKREARRAVKRLVADRVVRYESVHERDEEGKPVDVTISVLSGSDI